MSWYPETRKLKLYTSDWLFEATKVTKKKNQHNMQGQGKHGNNKKYST
jgi:hypothetical protein